MILCCIVKTQAYRLLKRLFHKNVIEKHEDRKSSYYTVINS